MILSATIPPSRHLPFGVPISKERRCGVRTFSLTVVTPDGVAYQGDATAFLARTCAGDVEILAGHTDYLAALATGRASIRTADGVLRSAALSGGVLSVKRGVVSVAATTFEYAEDIDKKRAERAKENAESAIRRAADERSLRLAKAKLERALLRIDVAGDR